MTWRLVITLASPSQNTREKQHWTLRKYGKAMWWKAIRAAPGFLLVPRATGKRRLTVERHARGVPQDPSNTIGGAKGIIDDLVQLGLLVDDTPEFIEHGTPRHVPLAKGERAFTVLILEDVAA